MDNSKLGNYLLYLQLIQKKFDKFFDNQKEYIACKKGCAKCCKNAEFPFTEIEFRHLIQGFFKLDQKLQAEIMNNIEDIIQRKKQFKTDNPNEVFRYDCPFIINNSCVVYMFRGIVCRTFGLISYKNNSNEKSKIPFCAFQGLNYSQVLDTDTKTISEEKYKELNYTVEPKAFNISYETLLDKEIAKQLDFEFGKVKPLIDWFDEFGQ